MPADVVKDGTVMPKFRQGKISPLFLTAKFSPRNSPLAKSPPPPRVTDVCTGMVLIFGPIWLSSIIDKTHFFTLCQMKQIFLMAHNVAKGRLHANPPCEKKKLQGVVVFFSGGTPRGAEVRKKFAQGFFTPPVA